MRALVVVALLSSTAAAEMKHEDVQLVRPELAKLVAVHSIPKGTGWIEDAREIRIYDGTGHLVRHEHRKPDGSIVVAYDYVWNAEGRIASYAYLDYTKRSERRDFTYKVDAQGRIAEKIMRDPSKPAGEYWRYEYAWRPDGSHDEQQYRHYPKEGPYRSDVDVYDAKGKLLRHCYEHGGCAMHEYDAQGNLFRTRQQTKEMHHYLMYEPTYDKANNLATRTVGNIVSSFTWNARGDVAEIVERIVASQGGEVRGKTAYSYTYR